MNSVDDVGVISAISSSAHLTNELGDGRGPVNERTAPEKKENKKKYIKEKEKRRKKEKNKKKKKEKIDKEEKTMITTKK